MKAVPGAGLQVPIYILGSSLFGAQVAAALGLPFAFASHFAPALMMGSQIYDLGARLRSFEIAGDIWRVLSQGEHSSAVKRGRSAEF